MATPHDVKIAPCSLTSTGEARLKLTSPYLPELPARARALGGRFGKDEKGTGFWLFDPRDEDRVRELARELYGTDGQEPTDTCTVHITVGDTSFGTDFYFAGRQVARVMGRDSGARLGDGVILLSGKLNSGGSMKHPCLTVREGSTIEIKDLPRALVERDTEKWASYLTVEIIEGAPPRDDVARTVGIGEQRSHVENIWNDIQTLSPDEQVEIRNRLLQSI